MKISNRKEFVFILGLIVLALVGRLIPHAPNFSPLSAIFIFSFYAIPDKRLAFIVSFSGLVLSDFYLGMSSITPFVYLSFAFVGLLVWAAKKINIWVILSASTIFFIVSNFGVWIVYYPLNIDTFVKCYTDAIPFYRNTLASDFLYTYSLVYSFKFIQSKWLIAKTT